MQFDSFTAVGDCDWQVPAGTSNLDADLVGGGGGGGISQHVGAGGGGGGQFVALRNMAVTPGALLTLTVGDGAPQVLAANISQGQSGANGLPTSFLSYTAAGGRGGIAPAAVANANIGGAGGASLRSSTITTTGTVLTTTWPGSVAVAGNSVCTAARNGGGGASSFGTGLQTGGTALTSSVGINGIATNTLFGYLYSGGGGGHRDPVSSSVTANTVPAPGGAGGGGDGGLGAFTVGGTPTYPQNGTDGTGGGGGGLGGTCGKHSFGNGAGTTRGGSGAVVIKYASASPMTTPVASGWQGYNQIDWPDYADTATTGYKLYWSTSSTALSDANIAALPAGNIVSIAGATASNYTHKNLTLGTTYFYRVAATYTNSANAATTGPLSSVTASATPELTNSVKYIQGGPNDTPRITSSFDVKDFVVPSDVTRIQVEASGASANSSFGIYGTLGTGGSVAAVLPVTPAETLKIYVGSQPMSVNGAIVPGWNGGGTSTFGIGGYGGGASDIRRGGTALANRILVAGAGGGRANSSWGGPGGGLIGGIDNANVIAGGTQSGAGAQPSSVAQISGTLGIGASTTNASSGAGGGGYWGGNSNNASYAGGGGSSYTDPTALNVSHTQGGRTGDGVVTLTYKAQTSVPNDVKAIPGQAQNTIGWARTPITGANGYKVYGGTSPNPTTLIATIASVETLAYVHTGLTNGTTYYYRVAATTAATTNNSATLTTGHSDEVAATPNFLATVKFSTKRATQNWVVPQGVSWIQVTAKGASANSGTGVYGNNGTGGTVSALLPVTPGETLNINVGSMPDTINGVNTAGWNGGGTSTFGIGGYGGGASDIRRGGTTLANRILVAGAGAGRANSSWGGPGGGLVGGIDNANVIVGGTQTAAGAMPSSVTQIFGTLGVGASTTNASSGAGGGGYWGGNSNNASYAGGGGSSFAHISAVNVIHTQGGVIGDGTITVSYPTVAYPVGVEAIPGQGFNTIIWDETQISGATGYKVYGGTTPNPTTLLTASAVPFGKTSYKHSGLTLGTTYYYRVTVVTAALESQKSAEVSAIPAFTVDKVFRPTRANQIFTVPSGVYWLRVTAKGSSSNVSAGIYGTNGTGGSVTALMPVTPGENLNLYVGTSPAVINGVNTAGWNGGGTSTFGIGGYGGGASDIRRGGTALANRILVAGAGAGRANSSWGGAGGGLIGGIDNANVIAGGTQLGAGWQPANVAQIFGTLGVGASTTNAASGAGGGGYWGGNSNSASYAGGGGSSYTDPDIVDVVHTQGGVTGDGSISLSYSLNQAPQNFAAVPNNNKVSISWNPSEITNLVDYQIFKGTSPNPSTLLATVAAGTHVYVDSAAVNGTTYYYRLVARATINSVATASQSTSDVSATPTAATTVTFAATRAAQNWQVPANVSWIQVVAKGAAGGAIYGTNGTGGGVSASLPVTPGETLSMYVGTQPKTVGSSTVWGWNGGGTSTYGVLGGGGGASDIRRGGTALANRILVAGAGAGRANSSWGGAGGGLIGGIDNANVIAGGTQLGAGWQPANVAQIFGTLGVGASTTNAASGAGGGGYWGGNSNSASYAGGGGSSFTEPYARNVVHTQGGNIGDGSITITYVLDTSAPTVTSVTSPATNTKQYKAGEDIYIDVNFSESVVVTGSPTLDINTGLGGTRTIAYVSGSGTASLRFLYTVLPGDDKTNIDIAATSALSISNGSTIDDAAGNNAVLTLPTPGSATSLSSKLLVVDGIVPLAPVMVSAGGGTQISIDWTDVTDTDLAKYNVYVSTDGINFNALNSVISTQANPLSQFTQQVVARGITYYYYVTSVDIHGNESDPSMTVSWSIAADGTIQTPSLQVKRLTNDRRQVITGMSLPGASVDVMDGGIVIGTVTADATSGAYSFTPSSDWSVDTHDITAKASLGIRESSPSVISKMTVDTVAPTFTSQLRSNPASEKTASVVLVWKLTFSEPMTSLDTNDFEVSGTTAAVASVTQTFGTTTSYDVRVTGGNIGTVNGGITLAFKSGQTATDIAGNPLDSTTPTGTVQNYILDHSYPVITLSTDKSVLGGGGQTASISFDISLDPLANDFTVDDVAVVGGTLSNFAVGATPTAYSATFTPTSGFQGNATVDIPYGMFNSMSGLPNLKPTQLVMTVDTVAPTVTSVTASPTTGTYKAGVVVPISVIFSEAVTVTGAPTLKLETGTTDEVATYASGSGTNTLVFNYTVQAGNTSADLNYFDTASLVLPITTPTATTIKDPGLNVAVLTLPAITAGTVGNLATNAAIVIDTTAPSAPTSLVLTPVGGTVIANTLNSTNTNMTASATITAGQATGGKAELVVTAGGISTVDATDATILAADTSVAFNLGATTAATLQAALAAGGSVTVRLYDQAGNLSASSTAVSLTVDYAAPTISAFTGLATTVSSAQTVTVTTSETTSSFATADLVSSCGGTGTLTGSGTSYSYAWTPAANTTGSCTFTIAAGAFTDAAGNPSVLFTKSTIIDNVAPTVTGVTAVSPNGTYIVGQSIDLAVNFTEPVTVVGSPTLAIKSTPSGTPATATYVSGSGTNKLVFTYSISVGDNSADLNYAATTSLTAGTSIRDAAGNNATLTLPAVTAGTAGNLATNAALVVDALAPTAPGAPTITLVGGTVVSSYINSTNTNITATISGLTAGDVAGGKAELLWTPTGGTAVVVAADTSISATDTSAAFNLGSTTAAALQAIIAGGTGGTGNFAVRLTDVSGNVSSAGTATSAFTVDYVKPTVAITSSASGTLASGGTASITFAASEPTSTFVTGDATANLGSLGNIAAIIGGTPNRYSATFTPNADGVWSVTANAGAFTDAAGNPNTAATPITGNADVTAPTAVKVSALDALYKAGDNVDIIVEFNEAVNVDVARTITLALSPSRTAVYQAGNGTNKVTFRYTVAAGDQSADLNYAATGNWTGTGTVADLAGNIASSFALPASTSSTASLAGTSNVKVDALAPTAANAPTLTVTGGAVANTLNLVSTNLSIAATWATADATLSQVEFLVAGNVIATQTISAPATATSATFALGTATTSALQAAMPTGGAVTIRLTDIAGNTATSSATTLTVDYVAPTVTIGMPAGTVIAGQTRTVTFTTSESTGNFAAGDVAVNAAAGTLGSFTGTGTAYSAVFTPTANYTGSATISIAGAVFTDAAGNTSTAATSVTRSVDTNAPTVTLNRSSANSAVNAVNFTVTGNKAIDCSTLATGAGIDFTVTGGALTAIDQTDSTSCTLTVTANATRGSPATVVVTKASTFSVSDAVGNTATALTITSGTITVTIPTVAPSAPTNLTGTPAATKAVLSWTAPVDTGGSAVSSYVLQKTSVASPVEGDWSTIASGDVVFAGTSATVSNLTNGTDYYFRVLAVNISGNSPYSTASAAINPYDVPAAPTIALTSSSAQIAVAITAPANNGRAISAYQWTLDGGLTWTAFSNTNLAQTLTGLVNGNAYSVKVRALNAAGAGPASSVATATPTGIASAPTITGISGGNGSAVVSFTAPVDNGGATIANYEYSTDGGTTFTALTTPSASSPMTITGLTNGTSYSIKIRAITSAGEGASSTAVTAYPLTVPSAPSALTATPGQGMLAVSFTAGATGGATPTYTVTATPDGGGSAISSIGSGSPITITGLSNGVNYQISVVATNTAGSSAIVDSGTDRFTPSGVPSIPVVSSITAGATTLSITFTSNTLAAKPLTDWEYMYRINNSVSCLAADYKLTGEAEAYPATWNAFVGTSSGGTLNLSGLTAGSCYDVKIRTKNANGYSAESRSSGKPETAPTAPVITSLTRGNGKFIINFAETLDNGGSAVIAYEYSLDAGGHWISAGLVSPLTVTQDATDPNNLTPILNGQQYSVTMRTKVAPQNAANTYSLASTASTVTPAWVPGQVVFNGNQVIGDGFIDFPISSVPGNGGSAITSYQFASSSDGITWGAWSTATWASANALNVRVGGITNATSGGLYYKLRAVNALGEGAASAATGSALTSGTTPATPTITAVAHDGSATLNFTTGASGGFTPVTVEYSLDGTTWLTATANPMIITGLTNGTTYNLQVRTTNAVGSSVAASASITPAGAASAPTITSITSGQGVATINFTGPSNTGGGNVSIDSYDFSVDGGLTWSAATLATGDVTAGTISLTGLTNGATYPVKIRANNSYGAGAASSAVNALPVAVAPGAPTVSATADRNLITIAVTAPSSTGGAAISNYQYSLDGTTWVTSTWVPGAALNFNITGLTNGTSYTVLVRAVNSAGAGADSNSVSATPSGATAALASISGYTGAAGQAAPTAVDYTDAGITSAPTGANLAALNSILAALASTAKDSTAEIQAIVDAFNKLVALADGVDNTAVGNAAELTIAEWALLGQTLTADQAKLANDVADNTFFTALDTAAELSALTTAVSHVIPLSSSITVADATVLGLTAVTSGNIASLQSLIAAAGSVAAVDTQGELATLATQAETNAKAGAALAIISGYDNASGSTSAVPTIADYAAAGVTGVDAGNLAAINELVGPAGSGATDSAAELQAITDAVNKLRTAANGSSTVSGALTSTDFAALGLTTIDSAVERALFNQIIAGDGFTAVDTAAERATFVALIDKLLALAAVTPPAALPDPTLTAADLAALGITGVTTSPNGGNLAAILAALAASANDGTGVDSIAEIQAIATTAAAGQAAMGTISGFTGANGQTSPTVSDYATAGITGVTSANLAMVNAFIASLPAGSRDTAAEIQAIVDAVNHLIAQANGASDGGTFVTVTDLTALGIVTTSGTATAEAALFNSIIDGLAVTTVDTLPEVQAYLAVVAKIAAQASGATGITITVAEFNLVGVTGVTTSPNGGNLAAMMNQIAATADNATGVDSVAELTSLVTAANSVAVRDNALATIIAYSGTQTALTTSTYADATVTGVTGLNVDAINSLIASLPSTAKDTAAEVQAVVDAYNKVYALADGGAGGAAAGSLTAAEFATLGLAVIDSTTEVALMNAYLDVAAGSAVDTAAELSALATAVSKLAATAAVTPPAATPTPGLNLTDLAALGINGVTAENLATVIAFIAASANDGSAVDSKSELQALVNSAAAQAVKDAVIADISLFDGTGTAPTRNNYADAGVTGVDLTNRDLVNSIVATLTPTESDTAAELQAVVTAADKIIALADGTAANGSGSALTATDLAAIGLAGVDSTAELALLNGFVDGAQIGQVDTFAELAELARVVQAIMLLASGGTPNPALTAADFELLGITGLDASSVDDMARLIAAAGSANNAGGSAADSLSELQTIATAAANAAATSAALDVISGYDGTNQAPVLSSYVTAGVTGVTSNNLTQVNSYMDALTAAQSDTAAEIQAAVSALTKLADLADTIPSTGTALTSADLIALGMNGLGNKAAKLALLNSLLDTLPFGDVDTPGELANLVDIVNRIVGSALGETVVPGLSPTDFSTLGITGVTDSPNGGNLSVIVAAVAGSGANGVGVDSLTELSTLVTAAAADFATSPSLKAIIDYANSNLNPLPTVIDYNQAGASMVDETTLEAVNAIVDSLTGGQVSSTQKVYQVVYDLFVALGKIVAFVADSSSSPAPTILDYKAAGLVAIDANSVSAMNAVIAGLTATDVDSTAKLAALLKAIQDAANAQNALPGASSGAIEAPVVNNTITKVVINTGANGALVLKWTGAPVVQVKVVSSTGQTQAFEANQQKAGQIIDALEPGRAYAIILAPLGNNDPNAAQSVAYAVPSLTPTSTEVTPVTLSKVQLTWKQQGFAKLYKIVVTPNKGAVQTFTTGERKLDLNLLGGRKYEATVTAIGEGDGTSTPAVIDINPTGAVTSVVATPFAAKKQTLVSWKPFEVKAGAKYVVKVDGKQVCLGSLTSCVVPRVLTAKNDVVVSVVGGAATAVDIDDRKLVYQAEITFAPNTTVLSAPALAAIKANAAKLKKAGFTKVVVTGHANPVDGIPVKISDKIANQRALVIATQLKKLLPGVRIVAVGRSVFSPAKAGAAQSLANIRAEVYGTK